MQQGVQPVRRSVMPWRMLAKVMLWTLVLLTCVAKFVPFHPDFPSAGLDASWRYAMGEVLAQHMHFGTDLIFTFGPYAPVYTRLYHPATDLMMLLASLYLALAYWLTCFLAFWHAPPQWMLAYCVFLAGGMYFPDALLFTLPLMLGLLVLQGVDPGVGWLTRHRMGPLYLALLFAPLGLLPLIKGSLLALCGAVALLCAAFLAARRCPRLAGVCMLSPLVAALLFWLGAGQPLAGLPAYVVSMLPIIAGYTEAMAYRGPLREVAAYVLASAVLLCAVARHTPHDWRARGVLGALYALYLFLAFKAGFVRQDGHAAIAASSLVLGALALPMVVRGRLAVAAATLALLCWIWIDSHYMHTIATGFAANVSATYRNAWSAAMLRLTTPAWPRQDYDAAVQALKAQAALPPLQGSTDIYAYQQSYLIASGNHWSPRPVLQSYSAYTPALAELNRQHLLGASAPDNVVFRLETIDGRFPSLDDGPSWPALLARYRPAGLLGDAVLLRKQAAVSSAEAGPGAPVATALHRFGETVAVPAPDGRLYVQFDIAPSWLGRIVGTLFRPDQLQLTVTLRAGGSKTFRLVSGMARAGFVLSPLVEDGSEFLMLYGAGGLLDDKRVASISLGTSSGSTRLWRNDYRVTFSALPAAAPADLSALLAFDHFAALPADAPVAPAATCEGVLDSVNGVPPGATLTARGRLKLQGWLTVLPAPRRAAQQVHVVLTDATGQRLSAPAHALPRPDVAVHFQQPGLGDAGYTLNADLTGLRGRYTLSLAAEQDGRLLRCEPFSLPIMIENTRP